MGLGVTVIRGESELNCSLSKGHFSWEKKLPMVVRKGATNKRLQEWLTQIVLSKDSDQRQFKGGGNSFYDWAETVGSKK